MIDVWISHSRSIRNFSIKRNGYRIAYNRLARIVEVGAGSPIPNLPMLVCLSIVKFVPFPNCNAIRNSVLCILDALS